MKAIRMHELGDPAVLRYEEIPDPEPGPGEVRLIVAASGLNRVDADLRQGLARFRSPSRTSSASRASARSGTA